MGWNLSQLLKPSSALVLNEIDAQAVEHLRSRQEWKQLLQKARCHCIGLIRPPNAGSPAHFEFRQVGQATADRNVFKKNSSLEKWSVQCVAASPRPLVATDLCSGNELICTLRHLSNKNQIRSKFLFNQLPFTPSFPFCVIGLSIWASSSTSEKRNYKNKERPMKWKLAQQMCDSKKCVL